MVGAATTFPLPTTYGVNAPPIQPSYGGVNLPPLCTLHRSDTSTALPQRPDDDDTSSVQQSSIGIHYTLALPALSPDDNLIFY